MNRRAFVGLLALFSGCSARLPLSDARSQDSVSQNAASQSPPQITNVTQPTDPAPTAPAQQGADPAAEPAEEPAPEPVEEPAPEPAEEPAADTESDAPTKLTEREQRGLMYLERAETRIEAVVAAFTRGYGSELTDVTASSVDFLKSDYGIQVALAEAQKRYIDASKTAANAEQERDAERLTAVWRFLRDTTRSQQAVIECYLKLEDAMTALEENDPKLTLIATDGLKETRWVAEREHDNVIESSSVDDVAAVESISAEEYEAKIGQFAADIALYRELDETLRVYADGVKWLARAKREFYERPRRIAQARDSAKDARDYLKTTRSQLTQLKKNAGEDATITPMLTDLIDLTKSQINEAQEIIRS